MRFSDLGARHTARRAPGLTWLSSDGRDGADLCPASKPYDKDDADGQQGAGEPEREKCLAPVRAVAHRIDDPDAHAPRVERPNKRGDESKAERAESRRPGNWGSPNPRPQDDRTLLSSWSIPTYLAVIGPNDQGKIGPST